MSSKGILALICVGALVVVLGVAAFAGGGDSPREWLEEHYTYVDGEDLEVEPIVYSSNDSQSETAAAIIDGTGPDDRASGTSDSGEDLIYLRYNSDWLVTVGEDNNGARIELFRFDEGYRRHSTFLVFWGGFYGRGGIGSGGGFRGGGGGFGK